MPPESTLTSPLQGFPWLTALDVGNLRIDGEHRALMELANDFCALAEQALPLATLRGAARELIAVTEAHFESEEALFPLIGYPEHSAHVREHLALLSQLNALLLDGPPDIRSADAARLLLIEHILRHDLGFKTWVDISHGH